jgi:hypothetical protein
MLREEVVKACGEGRFRVHGVATIHEALELLTDMRAGTRDAESRYPEGTLLAIAVKRARDYWQMAAKYLPSARGREAEVD